MRNINDRTISEIRAWLESKGNPSDRTLKQLSRDPRAGVRALAETYIRSKAKQKEEAKRIEQLWEYERRLTEEGFQFLAGIDEAGRGPLAGPVVAAAVILPLGIRIQGLNDSKQLSPEQRDGLFHEIRFNAVSFGIGVVDTDYIDQHNILQGTYEAMRRALASLTVKPDYLLNDAVTIPNVNIPQLPIIKGDAKSHSIAAASILAKVTRDKIMEEYGQMYPEYGFEKHMGYPTPEHLEALRKYGACPIHRKSFAPVAKVCGQEV